MNDFKFNCPKCGQHILANASWIGRRIDCPSCKTRITIPAPTKPQKKTTPSGSAGVAKSKTPPPDLSVEFPTKTDKLRTGAAPEVKKSEPSAGALTGVETKPLTANAQAKSTARDNNARPAPKAADTAQAKATPMAAKAEAIPEKPNPAEQSRIGVLSAAVKLELVQAARHRIASESVWLPGKVEGTTAYAAKMTEGKPVLLEITSPEATHFSLMGAVLFEMNARRVTPTATGRKKLLDDEIPEAAREVLLEQMDDETRESSEDALAGKELLAMSHAECLAALDALEERYSQRMEQLRIEKVKKRLGNVRLTDLVKKLEKKARVLPEDVATALFHELLEVRRRLERLESRITRDQ